MLSNDRFGVSTRIINRDIDVLFVAEVVYRYIVSFGCFVEVLEPEMIYDITLGRLWYVRFD